MLTASSPTPWPACLLLGGMLEAFCSGNQPLGCYITSSYQEQKVKSQHMLWSKGAQGFPGGPLVRNSTVNAGNTGSIPACRKILHALEQLSLWATTTESALESLEPWLLSSCATTEVRAPGAHAARERLPQWWGFALQPEEKATEQWRPSSANINE